MDILISDEAIEKFCEYLFLEEKSKAAIEKYRRELKSLGLFLEGKPLNKKKLLAYRDALLCRHMPQTVNGKLSAIHGFLGFMGREDCKVKYLKLQKRAFLDESRELTAGEYGRLLETAKALGNTRLYYILMTLCGTGIRISELKYITAETVAAGKAAVSLKGKNRLILIPGKLRKKLLIYMKKNNIRSGVIFCTRSGRPIDRSNVYHEMKKLGKDAGVERKKIFPHNLRHLFARKFYEIKKDLCHLADILGHSSIETTRIYTATSAREQEAILNQMNLVF